MNIPAFICDLVFFILAGDKDMHESLDEFEFWPDPTTDYGVPTTDYGVSCSLMSQIKWMSQLFLGCC